MSDPKASSNEVTPEELDKVAGGGGHPEVEGGHGSLTEGGHGSPPRLHRVLRPWAVQLGHRGDG